MEDLLASPDEVLATLNKEGSRRWLYPVTKYGRWWWRRQVFAWGLFLIYLLAPFVKIAGAPLLLLDLPQRKFSVFGVVFFATDGRVLLLVILGLILTIFAASAVLGRVWCGWACPQTVFLEFLFRPLEQLIEGPPNKRRRRDQAPWSLGKALRKGGKFVLFAIASAVVGNAFVAYFVGGATILAWMQLSPAEHPIPFGIMLSVTALVFFEFAYFREQFCSIVCPYARLQSVLLDRDSIIVAYDTRRGEPRGHGRERTHLGHCVDCRQCVTTCPAGIDIRNGLQLECIHCTQCIDACDDVMKKVGYPPGLIRYTSLRGLEDGQIHLFRTRTIIYALLLTAVVVILTLLVAIRPRLEVQLLRSTNLPYQVLENGLISNLVRVKLTNLSGVPEHLRIEGEHPAGAQFIIPEPFIQLPPEASSTVAFFVNVPAPELVAGSAQGSLRVFRGTELVREIPFPLLGPR